MVVGQAALTEVSMGHVHVLRVPGRPQPRALQSADSLCGRRGEALSAGASEPAFKTARCVTCGPRLPGQPQATSEERPHTTR